MVETAVFLVVLIFCVTWIASYNRGYENGHRDGYLKAQKFERERKYEQMTLYHNIQFPPPPEQSPR